MEQWEKEFEWLRVRHEIKDALGRENLPDLNAVLFLIGIQEIGLPKKTFTKEEKQDLMHVAVCTLLAEEGYYELEGYDDDGWPHFVKSRKMEFGGVKEQEALLIELIIQYFDKQREEKSEHYESH